MSKYQTMGDVRIAAREYGMTLDEFFFQTDPEVFEGVDWNNDEPSESVSDRLERLNNEMRIIAKYGQAIPDRMLTEYYDVLDKWIEESNKEWANVRDALENAPIGDVDDYATEKDIQL